MILWYNLLFLIPTIFQTNAEVLIDSDGGYKNVIIGISPNLQSSNIENLLSHLKVLFRNTSEKLFTASQNNIFFKDITFALPKKYMPWISRTNLLNVNSSKSFRKPDMFITDNDVFEKPYTVQHSGCGKPGLRVNIPSDFLKTRADKKDLSLVRQWAHYRYGVFDENGFSDDKVYPACYKVPGSDNIRINDCTNEKAIYEFQKNKRNDYEQFPNVCTPVPVKGKNDHIVSSLMTNIDFPEMSYFCDDDTYPHDKNAPTKQNALCREKSIWEVISGHDDFKTKSKDTSNVKPAFKYVIEPNPNFVIAVDTSREMDLYDRMSLTLNAFSYFMLYDLPKNSTVRLIDMKNKGSDITERTILTEDDAKWLIGMFPDTVGDEDTCVHCTIQKLLEDLKLDVNDIIIITATDITSNSWADNTVTMLKSNKVALHVIYFEEELMDETFLEKVAKNSGGTFFYIPEAFPPGSSVSSLTVLYEAFRSIYESLSWLNRKHVLVDQMTFSDNCSPKCVLSFPSDHTIETLQVIITGHKFERNRPVIRKSIILDNGIQHFISGNDSFIFKSEVPAYSITVKNPKAGKWNLSFERKPGFNKPVIAIVRATSKDFGDVINMQSWISTEESKNVPSTSSPPITIYSEIKKNNNPIIDVEVVAYIHQASYNKQWTLKLQDSGDGDPDITKNDGIFSKYLTDIVQAGHYSITIVAEKRSPVSYYDHTNERRKEINCCGSFIPEYLSFDSGSFKRVKTFQSFFVNEEKIGKTYPPRRVVDLRIDRLEILTNNKRCYVLYWTAPGENYDKGRALSYNIKVFKTREDALNNFESSYALAIKMLNVQGPLLEPHEAGTIQSAYIELTNLTSGTYFMALRTTSHSGKISDVSNVVELSYIEEQPLYTGTGYSNGEFHTSPLDGTTEVSSGNDSRAAITSDFGLAIGLTCGFLLLLIIIGFILFIHFERRKKAKNDPNPTLGQNTKMTESNDALCHTNGDGNISIISPVNSWGAGSLISHYETLQQQKTADMNETMNIPQNAETDSVSLTSSRYSYDNKFEQNSSIYDPIYYHQVRSQDELNYPYNPIYTPFDPVYTSSLRRLDGNNDIVLNPYAADNISYCSYSLNRNQASRLKTDV